MFIQILLPIFYLGCFLLVVEVLYMSCILYPYWTYDSHIFSPVSRIAFSLSCPLTPRSFWFWCSPVSLFPFVAHSFGVMSKNPSPDPRTWRYTSSNSFVINFCIWCEIRVQLPFLYVDIQLPHPLIFKRLFFHPLNCPGILVLTRMHLFLDSWFNSIDFDLYPYASIALVLFF